MTAIPQSNDNITQNKVLPISEKTEQPPQQQNDLITPPMSPINTSLSSNRPGTARSSLKITAGQTGLPWLTRDAGGDNYSPVQQSPEQMTATTTSASPTTPTSPPPKFLARPRTASVLRFPTRRRTMQKHIYSMKDGLDPVKVLCNRLSNWQISVKYLISMFQSIKKVESNSGKGYRKIDAKFSFPQKLESQFKSSHGVKDAWAAFRQYTRENSLIHQDFVDFIENEIIPILHIMIKDIHGQMHHLKQNKELHTASLWDCRKKADSIITRLNSDIYSTVNSQEKAKSNYVVPKRDPLLTKYVVISTIQDLYKQENHLHKEFLKTQDEYRQFEQEKIINVYTELFRTFEEYRIQHHLENLESVAKVATLFSAIETDSEWLDFLQHHENELVKQNAAFKDERTLDFPNVSHPLVQPLILGNLQRHHGKKWTEEYYILSPVGLLHRFKSEKEFRHSPLRPDTTMFIPQSTALINPTSQLLELKGKALGGLFGGGSKRMLELSHESHDVIKQWIAILGPMASQQETKVINTPPPVAMADNADRRSIHSKVLAAEDDNNQAEASKSGPNAASADVNAEHKDDSTPMQPIVESSGDAAPQINPITNTSSQLAEDVATTTTDDDDDFRRQTIEYSTHSPITETPPATTTANIDEHNPFVNKDNHSKESIDKQDTVSSATTSPSTPLNADLTTNNVPAGEGAVKIDTTKPRGPTREGSELYWDTNTTPVHTTSSFLG